MRTATHRETGWRPRRPRDRAIGFYVTCDDAKCADCFQRHGGDAKWLADGGFEGWTEALAILPSSASDTPTHCHECGRLITHELTDAGLEYVAEAVRRGFTEGKQNPVTIQWIEQYSEEIPGDLDGLDVPIYAAVDLYRLLPIDRAWLEREDLRKYALLAGWGEQTPTITECREYVEAINKGRSALGYGPVLALEFDECSPGTAHHGLTARHLIVGKTVILDGPAVLHGRAVRLEQSAGRKLAKALGTTFGPRKGLALPGVMRAVEEAFDDPRRHGRLRAHFVEAGLITRTRTRPDPASR